METKIKERILQYLADDDESIESLYPSLNLREGQSLYDNSIEERISRDEIWRAMVALAHEGKVIVLKVLEDTNQVKPIPSESIDKRDMQSCWFRLVRSR